MNFIKKVFFTDYHWIDVAMTHFLAITALGLVVTIFLIAHNTF